MLVKDSLTSAHPAVFKPQSGLTQNLLAGLVHLDDGDTGVLQVVDFVSQGQSQAQGLDLARNIVSWERPSQTSDWTSQHTLHWLLGDGASVDRFLDRHGGWSRDITNNNWWSDVSGTVRLDPSVLSEGVAFQLFTEVANHIVSFWLTVNQDIQTNFLAELDNQVNLLLDEVFVFFGGDLALVEFVSVHSDVFSLRERTNGGGWEQWQVVFLALDLQSRWERTLSGGQRLVDGSQSLLHLRVGGDGRFASGLDGSSVSSESLGNILTLSSLGQDNNLVQFAGSKREPVLDDRVQFGLIGQVDRGVQQGGRGGDNNSVSANFLDGLVDDSRSLGEVGLPDVSTVNHTNRQGLLVVQDGENLVEALWDSDKVEVETGDGQFLDGRQVWSDVTKVSGQNDFWQRVVDQSVEGVLVQSADRLGQVQDQDWLVDADLSSTSRLQFSQQLLVDWQELWQQVDWVQVQGVLVGLTQVQVRDRTHNNGSGLDAQFLSFQVLIDGLDTVRLVDLELSGVGEGWSDIVVVSVEPLDHLQSSDVNSSGGFGGLSAQTSTHGEQNVDWGQVVLQVSVWDGVEEQGQVQNLVIVGEIVGRNDLDTGVLAQSPVVLSQFLTFGQQSVSVDFAAPHNLADGVVPLQQAEPSELLDGLVDVSSFAADVVLEEFAQLGQVRIAQGELGVVVAQQVLERRLGVQGGVEALAVLQVGTQVSQLVEQAVLVGLHHAFIALDSVVAVVLLVLVGRSSFGTSPSNSEQLVSGDVLGFFSRHELEHLDGVEHPDVEEQEDHRNLDDVEDEEDAACHDSRGVLDIQHELLGEVFLAVVRQHFGDKFAHAVGQADARRGADEIWKVRVQPHEKKRHKRVETKVVVLPLGDNKASRPHFGRDFVVQADQFQVARLVGVVVEQQRAVVRQVPGRRADAEAGRSGVVEHRRSERDRQSVEYLEQVAEGVGDLDAEAVVLLHVVIEADVDLQGAGVLDLVDVVDEFVFGRHSMGKNFQSRPAGAALGRSGATVRRDVRSFPAATTGVGAARTRPLGIRDTACYAARRIPKQAAPTELASTKNTRASAAVALIRTGAVAPLPRTAILRTKVGPAGSSATTSFFDLPNWGQIKIPYKSSFSITTRITMLFSSFAKLAVAAALSGLVAAELPAIEIVGNKFFYSNNGSQFLMKGVAYQQDTANTTDGASFVDPLADVEACKRDIPYLEELSTNIIRVYALNVSKDHSECMRLLDEAGIYVIADLSQPDQSINRKEPEWTVDLFERYTGVVDLFQNYTNILGFFAGNEVTNVVANTDASAFVKAAVRDTKAYIKAQGYRDIPVGYSANDDVDIRLPLAEYFACGDEEERADFFGINMYEWCGTSTFQRSGYANITEEYKNLGIPIFFSEYGCNRVQPRTFQEVGTIFSEEMTDIWSGGIVYMYFQEANKYGLVSIDNSGEVSTMADFDNLKSEIASISPSLATANSAASATVTSCPTSTSNWLAATVLPPTPDDQICECMNDSLECVVDDDVDSDNYPDLFSFVCEDVDCSGINANGTTGDYGAYSPCSPKERLNFVLNLYYVANGKSARACDFDGSASTKASTVASSCTAWLSSAGVSGLGTVSGEVRATSHDITNTASGSSGSGSRSTSAASSDDSESSGSSSGAAAAGVGISTISLLVVSLMFSVGVLLA